MPKLSIIVPMYNVEAYLHRCINSILQQTYIDFELLLIDDGSTDSCASICRAYAKNDYRVRFFQKENRGVSSARNFGLKKAVGQYIGFVDGDDWIESDMYEILIASLEKESVDICVGGYVKDSNGFNERVFKVLPAERLSKGKALKYMLEKKVFSWELCDKVYKKKLFDNIFLDEEVAIGEDLLINWSLFNKGTFVFYKPINKYHYFIRENSACTSIFSDKQLTYLNVIEKVYLETKRLDSRIRAVALIEMVAAIVSFNLKMLLSDAEKYQNKIQFYQNEIRNNFCQYFFLPRISIRQRLGLVFFLLPYNWCLKLKYLARR